MTYAGLLLVGFVIGVVVGLGLAALGAAKALAWLAKIAESWV